VTGDRCSSVPMLQLLSSAMHEVGRRAGRTFSSQPRCSWLAGWLAGWLRPSYVALRLGANTVLPTCPDDLNRLPADSFGV